MLSDQPHRVSKLLVYGQYRYIIVRLPMEVPSTQIHVPRNRVTVKHGRLILEAGDSWGDEPSSPGWGFGSLRLLRYDSWGRCRLCLWWQVRRMGIRSLGSASIASLRCTKPDPRPVAMTSTGTNHGCGPVVLQG